MLQVAFELFNNELTRIKLRFFMSLTSNRNPEICTMKTLKFAQ